MDLIPDEELKTKTFVNLTPLVDFLFLVVAVFAVLAVTRTVLFDTEISLAKVTQTEENSLDKSVHVVNLSVNQYGKYKWITEFNEYSMENVTAVIQEVSRQQGLGSIPIEKTKILLHIDKQAPWESVATLVCLLKKNGHVVHPVYELETP